MSTEQNTVSGYLNVWQGTDGHQWSDCHSDGRPYLIDHDLADDVAEDVEAKSFGIRRIGVLHVRLKVEA